MFDSVSDCFESVMKVLVVVGCGDFDSWSGEGFGIVLVFSGISEFFLVFESAAFSRCEVFGCFLVSVSECDFVAESGLEDAVDDVVCEDFISEFFRGE